MDPLREHLASDRHRQWRAGEVGVGAGVLGVEDVRRDAFAELGEYGFGGRGPRRRRRRLVARTEEHATHLRVRERAHRAHHRLRVEPTEGPPPNGLAQAFERGARGRLVAEVDQLGLGMLRHSLRAVRTATPRAITTTPATWTRARRSRNRKEAATAAIAADRGD